MEIEKGKKGGGMRNEVKTLKLLLNNKVDCQNLKLGDHIYAHHGLSLNSHHGREMEVEARSLRLLLNNKIDSRKLQPGDHIYAYRGIRLYSHHGIYMGNEQVIHYIRTKPKRRRGNLCGRCGYQKNVHLGVVKSCLDCFLSEGSHFVSHSLRRYQYSVPTSWYTVKRAGSCSTYASRPPREVIDTATKLLMEDKGFGDYNLLENNCESFATFCKTGIPKSAQVQKPVASVAVAIATAGIFVGGAVYYLMKNKEKKQMVEAEEEEEDGDDYDDDDAQDDDNYSDDDDD